MVGEAGTDAREVQGRLEEGLAHAFAFFVPVYVPSVALVEEYYGIVFLAVGIYCIEDAVDGEHLALAFPLAVYGPESVSLLQSEEIHRPGVYVRKFENQQGRGPRLQHIVPQGAAYGDVGTEGTLFYRLGDFPHLQTVEAAEYRGIHPVIFIDHIVQTPPGGVSGVIGAPLVAGPEFPYVEDAVAGLAELQALPRVQAEPGKETGEIFSVPYRAFHRFKRVREEAQRVDSVSSFFCRVPAGPWALAGKKGQAQEHCPDQYR